MDLEVVGRHALLFDDDATEAFMNSGDALVDWNSLLIDRYDVRHLLQNPPPSFRGRRHQTNSSSPTYVPSSESELDRERYSIYPHRPMNKNGSHNTHFCLPQTLEAVKRICPKRALLIGMIHEFDHYKDNEILMEWSRREGIPVQLTHDGLRIPFDL